MSTDPAYLAILLDAPLMSWGHSSRFTRRGTALFPTRSALTGMICAALGAAKGSHEEAHWLERLDAVRLTVLALPRPNPRGGAPLPIRRMEDYHTVRGTRSAEGKPKEDAVITYRQYLLDARFAAILSGPSETLKSVCDALLDPRWGVWFGRKACIPAAPMVRGVSASLEAAMETLGLAGRRMEEFALVEEADTFAEGTDTIMDAPLNFATREFKPRRIRQRPPSRE